MGMLRLPPGIWELLDVPGRRKDWPPIKAGTNETIRQEWMRCGRPSCKCARATDKKQLHGPYWYLYYRDVDGKLHKRYIGALMSKLLRRMLEEQQKQKPTRPKKKR